MRRTRVDGRVARPVPVASRHRHGRRQPEQVLGARTCGWLPLGLVGALVVLTAALAVRWPPLEAVDHGVGRWAYELTYGYQVRSSWWRAVAEAGYPMVLRVLLAVAGLFQLWRGCRAVGWWLIGVPVAENLIAPLAKDLLTRPRPHWLHPIAVGHSTSYSSGHAAGAGMFATAVLLLAVSILASTPARWVVIAAACVVGVVVFLDRLFLGVHHLSDVVGGDLVQGAGR